LSTRAAAAFGAGLVCDHAGDDSKSMTRISFFISVSNNHTAFIEADRWSEVHRSQAGAVEAKVAADRAKKPTLIPAAGSGSTKFNRAEFLGGRSRGLSENEFRHPFR
jgi:hypothetical protein